MTGTDPSGTCAGASTAGMSAPTTPSTAMAAASQCVTECSGSDQSYG
jgi:hypothetical protein